MSATAKPNLSTARPRLSHRNPLVRRLECLFIIAMVCGLMFIPGYAASPQSINDQPPARVHPPPAAKLDINHASTAQLLRVPGITQIYAQRIVAGRPYSTKGQLKTGGILPPDVYMAVKDHLVAHRPKK
jgi:competence protein ComEA